MTNSERASAPGAPLGAKAIPPPAPTSAIPAARGARLEPLTRVVKKVLRTAQAHFPALLDTKFALMRWYRNALRKPFERDFEAIALFPLTAGALFADVGANRGQSTDAILMQRSDVRLELFEPNMHLFRKLEGMLGRDARVHLNDFGLGDEATEGTLIVPFYKQWMFDGLGSFDQGEAANWLRSRMYFYDDRHLTLHKSKCRIRTLDELNLAPFFVKLDIQGYEYKALIGGERTLRTHHPVLLIESPDDRTVTFLRGLGYQHYVYRRGKFHPGEIGTPNTWFMTPDKVALVREHVVAAAV